MKGIMETTFKVKVISIVSSTYEIKRNVQQLKKDYDFYLHEKLTDEKILNEVKEEALLLNQREHQNPFGINKEQSNTLHAEILSVTSSVSRNEYTNEEADEKFGLLLAEIKSDYSDVIEEKDDYPKTLIEGLEHQET
jgi:hypothetical protein